MPLAAELTGVPGFGRDACLSANGEGRAPYCDIRAFDDAVPSPGLVPLPVIDQFIAERGKGPYAL